MANNLVTFSPLTRERQRTREQGAQEYIAKEESIRKPYTLREVMQMRAELGLASPLEVMLGVMDRKVENAALARSLGDADSASEAEYGAVEIAKAAAPYVHPKLAAISLHQEDKPDVKIEWATAENLKTLVRGKKDAA